MTQGAGRPVKKDPYASREKAAPDFFAGVFLALLSLYVLVSSIRMPHYSGSGWLGSPGLTPGLIALALLLLSLALMVACPRTSGSASAGSRRASKSLRAGACFAMIFVYIAITPWIGYVPATFLLLFAFQTAFARKLSVRYVLIWSLGLSALLTFFSGTSSARSSSCRCRDHRPRPSCSSAGLGRCSTRSFASSSTPGRCSRSSGR